jgi:hypothetical protein
LDYAFRLAVSREPDGFERGVLKRLLESERKRLVAKPQAADAVLSTGRAPVSDGVDKTELAAWTAVARAILNLNETVTRN